MAGGSNLTDVQALNLRTVYDVVRLDGPISRAEIARRLDLAVPTISNIVRSLLDKGLLYEAPGPQGGRGKRPIALQVRPDGGFAIGLNVDRDRLDGVITDLVGTTRHRVQRAIGQAHPDEVLPHLQDMHEELLNVEGIPRDRIWGTGVAVPGPLHARDAMIEAAGDLFELPGWTGVDVHARLAERLGEPVAIENHAVAAAIGETWWGTGQRLDSFFLVYFGLYLGGAAVVNGTVARGATGFANEFGSIPVPTAGGAYAPLGTLVSRRLARAPARGRRDPPGGRGAR